MSYIAPDEKGFFGEFGGSFVSETLVRALDELKIAYAKAKNDPAFWEQFHRDLALYVGRPTPVYYAERLSQHLNGAKIYLKREDLNHSGAHKINNTIGQALLAKKMGKKRVIAETGAGSTVLPRQRLPLALVWNVRCLWVQTIYNAKPLMFIV